MCQSSGGERGGWIAACLAVLLTCGSAQAQQGVLAGTKAQTPMAVEAPIVFASSNDSSLPLAAFRDNELTSGILKDLGDAIAAELHRRASYVVVPRKRLDQELQLGLVDGVCYYRPEWMNAQLNWSEAFITNDILLVASNRVPKPNKLEDVSGKTIGVVLGYKYPELNALRQNYQRDDALTMPLNIKKLVAGRVQYAVIDRLSLDYQAKANPEILNFSTLSITKINAACGFSLASKIPFDSVNQAVHKLVKTGAVARILAQYR